MWRTTVIEYFGNLCIYLYMMDSISDLFFCGTLASCPTPSAAQFSPQHWEIWVSFRAWEAQDSLRQCLLSRSWTLIWPETEPRVGQPQHVWGPCFVREFIRQRERAGCGPSQSEHSKWRLGFFINWEESCSDPLLVLYRWHNPLILGGLPSAAWDALSHTRCSVLLHKLIIFQPVLWDFISAPCPPETPNVPSGSFFPGFLSSP